MPQLMQFQNNKQHGYASTMNVLIRCRMVCCRSYVGSSSAFWFTQQHVRYHVFLFCYKINVMLELGDMTGFKIYFLLFIIIKTCSKALISRPQAGCSYIFFVLSFGQLTDHFSHIARIDARDICGWVASCSFSRRKAL